MNKEPKTKLDAILRERGMKTTDLERALIEKGLKIEYYALSNYRSGARKNMTIETLNKLCVALDVTPNDLVEHDAVPVPHKKRYAKAKPEQDNTQTEVSKAPDFNDDYGF